MEPLIIKFTPQSYRICVGFILVFSACKLALLDKTLIPMYFDRIVIMLSVTPWLKAACAESLPITLIGDTSILGSEVEEGSSTTALSIRGISKNM